MLAKIPERFVLLKIHFDTCYTCYVLLIFNFYFFQSVDPLIETLKSLSSKSTEIILCQEQRDTEKQKAVWKTFISKLHEDFTAIKIPISEQDELYASPDIVLLKVKKK